jgi:hypothetical protein
MLLQRDQESTITISRANVPYIPSRLLLSLLLMQMSSVSGQLVRH